MRAAKKGQVSLEFLTNYAWAFLVALIVIGALAYFGVLNPSKYTPNRCMLSQEIKCDAGTISLNSTTDVPIIKMRISNKMASRIVVTNITYTNREKVPLSGCSLIVPAPAAMPATIMEGEGDDFISVCAANTGNLDIGDKAKLDVTVFYYLKKSGPEYTDTVQGELYNEVYEE